MLYTPAQSGGFMKQFAVLWAAVVILLISIVFLFLKIRTLEEQAPGLGEYMTTIQLHAGKLWFAAKAANWELAEYELDEMKETMETAKGVGGEKNGFGFSAEDADRRARKDRKGGKRGAISEIV
jgi:hypothetical protein